MRLKHNRKEELIVCCESIIRNAEKITDDWSYNQNIEVRISLSCNECPVVEVKKTIIPEELIEVMGK